MNIGLLKERINLFYPTSSIKNGYGEDIITYASSSLWARVKVDSVSEGQNGKIVSNDVNATVYIRPNANLSENAYFTWGGHKYNIVGIEDTTATISQFKARRIK